MKKLSCISAAKNLIATSALLLAAAAPTAFAQSAGAEHQDHKGHASTSSSSSSSSSPMTLDQSMDHMKKQMGDMKMSGDTDRDFANMMRMHHQHGIDMARAELAHGKDAKLKAMAKKIIAAQKKEIAQFEQWTAKNESGQSGQTSSGK